MPRFRLIVAVALAAAALVALPGLARAAAPSAHAVRVHHHVPGARGAHLRVRWVTSSAWD